MKSSKTIWIVLLMTIAFCCWLAVRPARISRVPMAGATVISISNLNDPRVTGILSNPQFLAVLHALEKQTGAQKLSEPEVTTYSPSYYENVNRSYYNMKFTFNTNR